MKLYTIQGEIIKEDRKIEGAVFHWVDIVIRTEEKYPQDVLVRFKTFQRNVEVGNYVKVTFIIRGWEHKNKYYVKLIGQSMAGAVK